MRIFDYSFLSTGLLPARFVGLAGDVGSLRGKHERNKGANHVFDELERIARIQSVKGSNAIEGIVTSDERIRAIVNGDTAPLDHNEAEIAGYRDALELVHESHELLDFRERDILLLHRTMMSHLAPDAGGRYKEDDNYILEVDSLGRRNVRFTPTPASETPEAVEQLCLAYLDARDDATVNQLLLVPCVILDFLCIHPFRDGNGRLSRLLTLLLLYRVGYDVGKYVSFEEQINKAKGSYYDSLHESSLHWHEGANSYYPFMENFLITLHACYRELDSRFDAVDGKPVSKRNRVRDQVLNSIVPISKGEIAENLPDVSVSTIEIVLRDLVEEGVVAKMGRGRATRYTLV